MTLLNFRLFSKIFYALILVFVVIFGGTIGFMWIEGWSATDSFYMCIITVSTVGFSEVQPLSESGKIFTTILIMLSLGTLAYSVTSISSFVFDGEYRKQYRKLKSESKINKMRNHVIICGFGRVGRQAAEDLIQNNKSFVVVELDTERTSRFEDNSNYKFIIGDATVEENLLLSNIEHASAIITCMPSDADNLYVTLGARELNKGLKIISRASKADAVKKLKMAGANNVIMPDSVGGSHMASLVLHPDVMEFLDIVRVQGDTDANVISLTLDQIPQEFHNKPIGEFNDSVHTGSIIIGLKEQSGKYLVTPGSDYLLTQGITLFVLGNRKQIAELKNHFDVK